MEELTFKCRDGKELYLRFYNGALQPRGIVLIIHGMSEHSGRYDDFAQFLEGKGLYVYAPDHRGHGKTENEICKIGKGGNDLFGETVADIIEILEHLSEKFPLLPIVVFGHSYGSFLTQEVITQCHLMKGVVLSGTSYFPSFENQMGHLLMGFEHLFVGKDKPAKMMHRLMQKSYTKKFSNKNWLSRRDEVMEIYNRDPFCMQVFSVGYYHALFKHGMKLYNKEHRAGLCRELPLFILGGECDPVGTYGKGARKLKAYYEAQSCVDVTLKLYEGGRHEMLNETNGDEVYYDVLTFIERVLNQVVQGRQKLEE